MLDNALYCIFWKIVFVPQILDYTIYSFWRTMINEIAEGDRRKVYLETWDLQINFASIALTRIQSHFHIFDKN